MSPSQFSCVDSHLELAAKLPATVLSINRSYADFSYVVLGIFALESLCARFLYIVSLSVPIVAICRCTWSWHRHGVGFDLVNSYLVVDIMPVRQMQEWQAYNWAQKGGRDAAGSAARCEDVLFDSATAAQPIPSTGKTLVDLCELLRPTYAELCREKDSCNVFFCLRV